MAEPSQESVSGKITVGYDANAVDSGIAKTDKTVAQHTSSINKSLDKTEQQVDQLGSAMQETAKKGQASSQVLVATQKRLAKEAEAQAASQKRLAAQATEAQRTLRKGTDLEIEREKSARLAAKETERTRQQRLINERTEQRLRLTLDPDKRYSLEMRHAQVTEDRSKRAQENIFIRQRVGREDYIWRQGQRDKRDAERKFWRNRSVSEELFGDVNQAIRQNNMLQETWRQTKEGSFSTLSQTWQQQMNQAIAGNNLRTDNGRVAITPALIKVQNAARKDAEPAIKEIERIEKEEAKLAKQLANQAKERLKQLRKQYADERKRGVIQAQAIAENDRRDQRMGRSQVSAYAEDERRTRQMGVWQSAAMIANQKWEEKKDKEIQRMGRIQARAIAENERIDAMKRNGGFWGSLRGIGGRLAGMGGGGVAGSLLGGVLGGMGIGLGGYALSSAAGAIIESTKLATSYERQMLAARNLAGSQEELNKLLATYEKSSGGAVDKATSLENVSRLLATGYAKNTKELERFVKATRGASIALGRPQDYVIQETQLAISNTSVKRLDQIGLGIEEVQDKIRSLRDANSSLNRESAFQEAVLELMSTKYGHLTDTVEGQATGVEKLRTAWENLRLEMGKEAKGPVNAVSEWIADSLNSEMEMRNINKQIREMESRYLTGKAIRSMKSGRDLTQEQYASFYGLIGGATSFSQMVPSNYYKGIKPKQADSGYSEEVMDVLRKAYDSMLQTEQQFGKARVEQTRQYEEQRTNVIKDFAKTSAREEEDFQRSRARSRRDYERSVVDMMRDSVEREAEMRSDLDKNIAKMRQESNKNLAEMETEYREDRERAEKDHLDNMMKAAGQLDAIAILEERKRWRRDSEDSRKNHDKQVSKAKEALDKQIADANEAYQEQLEDARKADAKRLEDMRIARDRQLMDEDEDRALRLARAKEDHDAQLEELDRQHKLRMEQIDRESADQKELLKKTLEDDLSQLNFYIDGYIDKIKKKDEVVTQWVEGIIKEIEDQVKLRREQLERGSPGGQPMQAYADGGYVPNTGPAILHAGEYVLSRSMLANGFNPVTSSNSYNNSRSINIQSGAIQVQTRDGMEMVVGELVERQLIQLLESV